VAIRPRGLSSPPQVEDESLQAWLQEVKNALDDLPFSIFSTTDGPNSSNVTAPLGTFGIDIGSSATKLWFKRAEASPTAGWSYLSFINP